MNRGKGAHNQKENSTKLLLVESVPSSVRDGYNLINLIGIDLANEIVGEFLAISLLVEGSFPFEPHISIIPIVAYGSDGCPAA